MLGSLRPDASITLRHHAGTSLLGGSKPPTLRYVSNVENSGYEQGTWVEMNNSRKLAIISIPGVIKSAHVTTEGISTTLAPESWTPKIVRQLKQRLVIHWPMGLDLSARQAMMPILNGLDAIEHQHMETKAKDKGMSKVKDHHSFVRSGREVQGDGVTRHRPEIPIVWSPWEDHRPAQKQKQRSLLDDDDDEGATVADLDPNSVHARSDLDPRGTIRAAVGTAETFIWRSDVGAVDEDGEEVPIERLSEVFRPGSMVEAQVTLRYFKIGGTSTFQTYMVGLRYLGTAYEDSLPAATDTTSPGNKRKAEDDDYDTASLFSTNPLKYQKLDKGKAPTYQDPTSDESGSSLDFVSQSMITSPAASPSKRNGKKTRRNH